MFFDIHKETKVDIPGMKFSFRINQDHSIKDGQILMYLLKQNLLKQTGVFYQRTRIYSINQNHNRDFLPCRTCRTPCKCLC